MTALPERFFNAPRTSRPRKSRQRRNLGESIPLAMENATITLESSPVFSQNPLPTGLQVLISFQKTTSWATLGLVGMALTLYGLTVYTPIQWSREFAKLKTLQQTERQLIANTESLKHQLAQQAEKPNSGLVKSSPQQNIFLPASSSLPQGVATPAPASSVSLFLAQKPVAY